MQLTTSYDMAYSDFQTGVSRKKWMTICQCAQKRKIFGAFIFLMITYEISGCCIASYMSLESSTPALNHGEKMEKFGRVEKFVEQKL